MERDGSGVSALVGIDGFVVTAQLLDEVSGEWWLAVETLEDRAWCETCAVRAVGHGRRRVVVRDLPLADRPVVLVWAKRLWRLSGVQVPTEVLTQVPPTVPHTAATAASRDMARCARAYVVSQGPGGVMTDRDRAQPLIDLPEVARRLGVNDRHVRRLVAERRIPFVKWGHLLRFDPVTIEAWLEEHRQAPLPPA